MTGRHTDRAPASEAVEPRSGGRRSRGLVPLDLVRGFLIGMAELVPGVSGGTVALVVGVYERLIESAAHVLGALRRLGTGPERSRAARAELRRTDWWLVVPVLVGMAIAVVTAAGVVGDLVVDHSEHSRGLFLGLVAASVAVPVRMMPARERSLALDGALLLGAFALGWFLIGLASGREPLTDPSPVLVLLAAAIAVCALVVPGVSGSFFLLAIGLYTVTLDAIHERDLGYVAVFAVGAVVGLASFVQVLRWLLRVRRRATLMVMTGLMLGSLRALWPWQDSDAADGPGALLGPTGPVAGPVLLALLGAVVVVALIVLESSVSRRREIAPETLSDEESAHD
ncbi:DUF368 domain-containing protein [Nocardioides sp.]|uniref:DUF368 domain-containing protein n=1 Tax=Nocardioides sp. TaxID=35761 RepID=UPI002733769D|nr:DUF368 domain-containing protein [Nocardioides sp.]MDP3889985.1 DUF368 domain-containing protein [Nocardioides sp.]